MNLIIVYNLALYVTLSIIILLKSYSADFLLENIAVREHHESFTDSMQGIY